MFCPSCRTEYVEGVTECADCRVALVARLPDPPPPVFCVEVLRTYNQGDIALIRSVLDDARLEYFFRDEIFNLELPLTQPARLCVREDQADEARELLRGLDVIFLGVSSTGHAHS
jgi:hypothetical protein